MFDRIALTIVFTLTSLLGYKIFNGGYYSFKYQFLFSYGEFNQIIGLSLILLSLFFIYSLNSKTRQIKPTPKKLQRQQPTNKKSKRGLKKIRGQKIRGHKH